MDRDEWYRGWFGEEYLALYPHRDRAEAAAGVELFLRSVQPGAAAPILDLACGAGRHLGALRASGRDALGLDLSLSLLRRAREGPDPHPVVCGDMRALPFRSGSFAGVTSFFTSFGYFENPSEDARVLAGIRRVLRDGGVFLLDYLNAARVRRELVAEDTRRVGGRRVRQCRHIRDGAVCKRIEVFPDAGGEPEVFFERVRLYTAAELEDLLGAHGLAVERCFGDYAGQEFTPDSPRLILTGRTT